MFSPASRRFLLCLVTAIVQVIAAPAHADAGNAAVMEQAEALDKKAQALADAGDTNGAIEAQRESLRLQEEQIIPQLPVEVQVMFRVELTESKLNLIQLYASQGNFAQSAALLEAEIRFHESVQVPDRFAGDLPAWRSMLPQLQSSALLSRVKEAMALHDADRDSEALLVLQEVLPELDRATGIAPEQLASVNLIAARVLSESLAYAEAEARYLRALQFGEQAYGTDATELLVCLSELGQLAITRGTPERGAKYLVRAHAIAKAKGDPALPGTVKDLGLLLWHRGDHAEAISVLQRAIALYGAQSGPSAELGGLAVRLYLASVQDAAGRFDDAEATYQVLRGELDALLAREPSLLGLQAVLLRAYGVHHLRQAHYEQAEKALLEANAVTLRIMPADSPNVIQQGCDLGEVYWAAGDLKRSLGPIGRCFDSREADIARVLATGTEEQKRAFLGSYLVAFQKTMNAQRLGGNDNLELNRLALTQVLRTKGRVLDAMTTSGLAARASQTEETRGLMLRLTSVRAQMAKLVSSGMGSAADLKRLSDEAAAIEGQLGQVNTGFAAAARSVDLASVQQRLGPSDVLLEIVEYRPLDAQYKKAAPDLRYLAYVLHNEGEPQAFDLGPASRIDAAVNALRALLRHPERDVMPAARTLHDLVIAPVAGAFAGKTHVFLAPDGSLNAVPFAALANKSGFLVEQYDFTYLTSGRELLRFGAETAASGPIVAFANPDFGTAEGQVSSGATKLSRVVFPPLPGTQEEADALKRLFPDAVVHTGSDATESALKQVSRPFALHLATHGYFLPTASLRNLTSDGGDALDLESAKQRLALAENPLVRSGLAFAGATGLRGQNGEDGVLTALEASGLDLTGTQLVVLSACQTAEGEISQGEGVYGLRRALTVAGAESLVMSLWSVDDEATSYLMRGYYRRLKEGMGRSAALRDVQLALLHEKATHHPYYWAAFIPSGNPGSIVVPEQSTSAPSDSSSGSASDSSDDDDDDDDDDEYWPTATPSFGASLGVVRLSLTPNDTTLPKSSGLQAYVSFDLSVLSGALEDAGGNEARGIALYDRLGVNLGIVTLSGDKLATLNWDYSMLLGYRAHWLGLFGGFRWGSGTLAVADGPENAGAFFPPAARVELPWFGESRISALGFWGGMADKREVMGVDIRIPLGDPTVWLQTGFTRLEGRSKENNQALMIPVSIGFTED